MISVIRIYILYLHAVLIKQPGPASHYSGIPISPTLIFSNLPITRTKSRSLSSVEHCNFTPDFSNQFAFPLEVREIGIPLYMLQVSNMFTVNFIFCPSKQILGDISCITNDPKQCINTWQITEVSNSEKRHADNSGSGV